MPAWCRDDAAALYAWCRRCDDAVDGPRDAPRAPGPSKSCASSSPIYGAGLKSKRSDAAGFQDVVRRHAIPRRCAEDLVDGMAMDIGAVRYQTFDELLLYCYRVAGTVGLMMAHVMGVRNSSALRRAVDLGVAMQLTNICRDVAEDAARDRIYLPADCWRPAAGPAIRTARLAVRWRSFCGGRKTSTPRRRRPARPAAALRDRDPAARLIYAEIGRVIARRHFDVRAGRAVVSRPESLARPAGAVRRPGGVGARVIGRVDLQIARRPCPLPFPLFLESIASSRDAR